MLISSMQTISFFFLSFFGFSFMHNFWFQRCKQCIWQSFLWTTNKIHFYCIFWQNENLIEFVVVSVQFFLSFSFTSMHPKNLFPVLEYFICKWISRKKNNRRESEKEFLICWLPEFVFYASALSHSQFSWGFDFFFTFEKRKKNNFFFVSFSMFDICSATTNNCIRGWY